MQTVNLINVMLIYTYKWTSAHPVTPAAHQRCQGDVEGRDANNYVQGSSNATTVVPGWTRKRLYVRARTLRSSSKTLLSKPYCRLEICRRSFRCSALTAWNNIPDEVGTIPDLRWIQQTPKNISIQTVGLLLTDSVFAPTNNVEMGLHRRIISLAYF